MGKAVKKIHAFLVFALTACLVALRTVQLCLYTENSLGHIVKGAEGTIILFYSGVLLLFLAVLLCFYRKEKAALNPFEKNSSALCLASVSAGLSMFCDFIFRIIISYNYISDAADVKLNYFIPLCVSSAASLLCSFYFIAVGISFHTDKYSFKEVKHLHVIPLIWTVSILVTCLTENVDVRYAEEELFHYMVLIFAILFYILFIMAADGSGSLRALGVFGIAYGVFAMIISLPRFIAFMNGVRFGYTHFSTIVYLFTGIFALAVSWAVFGQKKKDI